MTAAHTLALAFWDRFGYESPLAPNDMAQFIIKSLEAEGYQIVVKR